MFYVITDFRYNDRVTQWQSLESDFYNTTFTINNSTMELVEMPQLFNFPIADSCNETGDPSEGCFYSNSFYYSYNYTINSDTFNITILNNNGNEILSGNIPIKDISRIDQRKLNCWDRESCQHACRNLNGKWSIYSNECIVTRHLQSICYRVTSHNGSYVLDKSGYLTSQSI